MEPSLLYRYTSWRLRALTRWRLVHIRTPNLTSTRSLDFFPKIRFFKSMTLSLCSISMFGSQLWLRRDKLLNRAAAFGHRFQGSANSTFFLKVASQIAFLSCQNRKQSQNIRKKNVKKRLNRRTLPHHHRILHCCSFALCTEFRCIFLILLQWPYPAGISIITN